MGSAGHRGTVDLVGGRHASPRFADSRATPPQPAVDHGVGWRGALRAWRTRTWLALPLHSTARIAAALRSLPARLAPFVIYVDRPSSPGPSAGFGVGVTEGWFWLKISRPSALFTCAACGNGPSPIVPVRACDPTVLPISNAPRCAIFLFGRRRFDDRRRVRATLALLFGASFGEAWHTTPRLPHVPRHTGNCAG